MSIQALFTWLAQQHLIWGLTILGLGAGIEYVFPPFPGDAMTLVGAMLIPRAGWPLVWVFAAILLGSMVGAAINWRVGKWLGRRDGTSWLHRWIAKPNVQKRVEALTDKFERYGSIYICLNRFLPAFRALFFVAAGMANLPLGRVLAFGALSAALWNAMLLGVGYLVGYNLDVLAQLMRQYSVVVWSVMGVVLIAYLSRLIWRRFK